MKKIMVSGVILIIFMLSFSAMGLITIDTSKLYAPGKCISKTGLEGLWDAKNTLNAYDSSEKQRTGLFKGDVVVATDSFGDYFSFPGKQSSYIEIVPSPDLDLTGSFTIEGWIWQDIDAEYGWKVIVGKPHVKPSYSLELGGTDALTGRALIGSGEQKLWDNEHPLPKGKWIHVAFTYNTNTLNPNAITTMYIDGTQSKQITTLLKGTLQQNDNALRFGYGLDSTETTPPAPWKGRMDEIAIWSRALSASDIQSIYNCPGTKKASLLDADVFITPPSTEEPPITPLPPPPPCQEVTCQLYGANCGIIDNCGKALKCGTCSSPEQVCINNVCEVLSPPETPTPWDTFSPQDQALCNAVVALQGNDKTMLQSVSDAVGNAALSKLLKLASIVNAVKAWLAAS